MKQKLFAVAVVLLLCLPFLYGQKPPIDTSVFGNWPSVGPISISNNGHFVTYYIEYQTGRKSLVLQSTRNDWKLSIAGFSSAFCDITADSRFAVFPRLNDSLAIVELGTSAIENIPNVTGFKIPKKGGGEWLAYKSSIDQKLVLRHLQTGKESYFEAVQDYLFSDNGRVLVLVKEFKEKDEIMQSVVWVNLSHNTVNVLWEGMAASSLVFDNDAKRLAFIGQKKDLGASAIWYYEAGKDKAELVCDDQTEGMPSDMQFETLSHFSNDEVRIFFSIKKRYEPLVANKSTTNIWSYTDAMIRSVQVVKNDIEESYKAVVDIRKKQVIRLEQHDEVANGDGQRFIIKKQKGRGGVAMEHWNVEHLYSYYMLSLEDGKRIPLKMDTKLGFEFSPEGKFVICNNFLDAVRGTGKYFNYSIITKSARDISGDIKVHSDGIATWLKGDMAMLIYDEYDIWQVDPSGNTMPTCITNGYGRRKKVVLRLAENLRNSSIEPGSILILAGFNEVTKENGFFRKALGKAGDPECLSMGQFVYWAPSTPKGSLGFEPLKARNAEVFVVKRMSASESPNYFATYDFKNFRQLSEIYPERNFNWLKSELHTWKTADGTPVQGILYKPENFDPEKKYPVIFQYYEKKSQDLNVYKKPEVMTSNIDIPFFVSNGYLVCQPDIHYRKGKPGESALAAVESAARYLAKFPWVNASKFGIQGFSTGGFETNYIAINSNLFAAAISGGAAFSNAVSFYGTIHEGGSVWQLALENDEQVTGVGIGTSLWARPDFFLENSPVLNVEGASIPFLMMTNTGDGTNNFGEAVQLFTALRRLGKKAWLLQYDDGGHGVFGRSAVDYTIRIVQFFDHYLKDKPAPEWMIKGIPAVDKGVKRGFKRPLNSLNTGE